MRFAVLLALFLGGCATTRHYDAEAYAEKYRDNVRVIAENSTKGCLATLADVREYLNRMPYIHYDHTTYCDGTTMVVSIYVKGMPDNTYFRVRMLTR